MRFFDAELLANSRPHQEWWEDICVNRDWFHTVEENFAAMRNSSAVLPRDAWLELDDTTRRILRDDGGAPFMNELMPLAKSIDIGKTVSLYRVSSDAGQVVRSMSGQVPIPMDKVVYDWRGTPVPIFSTGYGREWREFNTLKSVNFDALADDQEAHSFKLRNDMARFVLNGDASVKMGGYQAYGIMNHPFSKPVNLGTAAGGAGIDLSSDQTTSDEIDAFFTVYLGTILDANKVRQKISLYVSPEIGRRFDLTYSGSAGYKGGSLLSYLLTNRRIGKIEVTDELTGNQFFAFVPSSEFIRPLIGMAVATTPMVRLNPTDNYQFLMMGAMGLEIKADFEGHAGVFHSVVQN